MRTALVYLLALGALATGLVFGFPELFAHEEAAAEDTPTSRTAPPVIVALVRQAPFSDSLDALGTILANESVAITTNRADHIETIHFTDGQIVQAGDLLVQLHDDQEQALLAEAVAMRDQRRVTRERVQGLFRDQMNSRRELDEAEAMLAAAEARVISLQAAIKDLQVRSPFAGTLGLRRVSVGTYVQPATVITTLDDLSRVKLDFTIPETWLANVRPGMKVTAINDAWPDTSFVGEVATLDTRLDRRTRSATVRALLANPEAKLRPGMLMKVRVGRGDAPVLQIPEEALIPIGTAQHVLRVDDDDVAHRIEIAIGRRRVGTVEVLGGLAAGDRVVVQGLVKVRPGSPVIVVKTQAPDA